MNAFNKDVILKKQLLSYNKMFVEIESVLKKLKAQTAKCIKTLDAIEKKEPCNGQANQKNSKRCSVKSKEKSAKRPAFTLEDGQKTRLKDLRLPKSFGKVVIKAKV